MGQIKPFSWSRMFMDRHGRVPCKIIISHAFGNESEHTVSPISYVCCMLIWMANSQSRRQPQDPFSVSLIIVLLMLQSWCSTPLFSASCWTIDRSKYVLVSVLQIIDILLSIYLSWINRFSLGLIGIGDVQGGLALKSEVRLGI